MSGVAALQGEFFWWGEDEEVEIRWNSEKILEFNKNDKNDSHQYIFRNNVV